MENLSPAEQKLDVSQFKPGVYMLKTIDNAGRSSVYRLLIQR
jgi:hypothetical protein